MLRVAKVALVGLQGGRTTGTAPLESTRATPDSKVDSLCVIDTAIVIVALVIVIAIVVVVLIALQLASAARNARTIRDSHAGTSRITREQLANHTRSPPAADHEREQSANHTRTPRCSEQNWLQIGSRSAGADGEGYDSESVVVTS